MIQSGPAQVGGRTHTHTQTYKTNKSQAFLLFIVTPMQTVGSGPAQIQSGPDGRTDLVHVFQGES
jgi:hypothetical protein